MGAKYTLPELRKRRSLTTGQVAKLCEVAPRTVSKWVDSGKLRGYRIPGSQDRRIPRENLVQFLIESGMPLGILQPDVVAGLGHLPAAYLDGLVSLDHGTQFIHMSDALQLGKLVADGVVIMIVLDGGLGVGTCLSLVKSIKGTYPPPAVAVVTYDDQGLNDKLIDFQAPVADGPARLLKWVAATIDDLYQRQSSAGIYTPTRKPYTRKRPASPAPEAVTPIDVVETVKVVDIQEVA